MGNRMLIYLLLLVTSVIGRRTVGTISTVKPWLFLDRFVFHNNVEGGAKAIIKVKFHKNNNLMLNVYFNSAADASQTRRPPFAALDDPFDTKDDTSSAGMSKPDVTLFKDVYQSDQTCMWRDRQSRRWGNTFDLGTWWSYSSTTGEGLPNHLATTETKNAGLGWFPVTNTNVTQGDWRYASLELTVASSSPKWFYFVVSNCLPSRKITANEIKTGLPNNKNYAIVGTPPELVCSLKNDGFCQGPLDHLWYSFNFMNDERHVSYDESTYFSTRLTMTILYSVLILVVFSHVHTLSKRKKLHHTVKLLMFSVFISLLGHVLGLSYWNQIEKGEVMTRNYQGANQEAIVAWPETIKVAATFCDLLSHVMTLVLLILIAKGWTITRRKISAMGRVRLSIYATIYGCVYLSALGWSIWGFDPALVTFLYESPPGALIQTMRFFSSLWFAYACWTTVRSNPQKRKFYAIFSSFFFVWIVIVPFLVIICTSRVSLSHRGQTMFLIEHVIMLIGHIVLTVLWTPSNFDRIFPFFVDRMTRSSNKTENSAAAATSSQNNVTSSISSNRLSLSGGNGGNGGNGGDGGDGGVRGSGNVTNGSAGNLSGGSLNGGGIMDISQKALYIATSLKYRLMMMQDQTDDLVDAITLLNEETEVELVRNMAVERATNMGNRSEMNSQSQRNDGKYT